MNAPSFLRLASSAECEQCGLKRRATVRANDGLDVF
jgi:hypothetical protein